mmetsp:Transcript_79721/g.211577  ORF Transcript_79721/g.211577 Transcript_79721/m.211577 type:complete len:267 (+) Transcript_79721:206-1006(+)
MPHDRAVAAAGEEEGRLASAASELEQGENLAIVNGGQPQYANTVKHVDVPMLVPNDPGEQATFRRSAKALLRSSSALLWEHHHCAAKEPLVSLARGERELELRQPRRRHLSRGPQRALPEAHMAQVVRNRRVARGPAEGGADAAALEDLQPSVRLRAIASRVKHERPSVSTATPEQPSLGVDGEASAMDVLARVAGSYLDALAPEVQPKYASKVRGHHCHAVRGQGNVPDPVRRVRHCPGVARHVVRQGDVSGSQGPLLHAAVLPT